MSDVNFVNTYNDILFENFTAVVKQNLIFQTQLKVMEPQLARLREFEQRLADTGTIHTEVAHLQAQIETLTAQVNDRSWETERHRLQTALNDSMKECETLKATLADMASSRASKRKITSRNIEPPLNIAASSAGVF